MDDLTNRWKKAKQHLPSIEQSMHELWTKAMKKKKQVRYAHYGAIVILTITLIVISLFFIYVAPLQEIISRIGIALMTGGLAIRIVVELFSVIKSKKIDLSENVAEITGNALRFYQFRKRIHGPITSTIVALYILGFYMLIPEFSNYIEITWMIVLCISVLPISIFLIWQIKKGIQQEMKTLHELTQISTQLSGGEENEEDDNTIPATRPV